MSGLDAGCPGPVDLAGLADADGDAPGPDVRGLGRMHRAWKVNLSVSSGSLHPWSGQLVHLHVHPRDVLLDT